MSAVHTGDIAPSAADTAVIIKDREQDRIPFNAPSVHYGMRRSPDQVLYGRDAFTLHVLGQAFQQVVDDPVSVLHHCRGDLDAARPEKQKLHRVAPVRGICKDRR